MTYKTKGLEDGDIGNKAQNDGKSDDYWMWEAIKLAIVAYNCGEVPVGAVVVKNDTIIGSGYNLREKSRNPLLHAEVIAINQASSSEQSWRLIDSTLYVTLEPCVMCTGAILLSRIPKVVYGADDLKAGAMGSVFDLSDVSVFNHSVLTKRGCLDKEAAYLLKSFFIGLRKRNRLKKKISKG